MVFTSTSVSAMSGLEDPSLAGQKITVHKLPCVGGNGGYAFDSGVNPYGVARVHVECSPFDKWGDIGPYESTIARVFVDFHQSISGSNDKNQFYSGCDVVYNENKQTFTFELPPGDWIYKAVVWSDGKAANAVQFHARSGIISPIYGIPQDNSEQRAEGVPGPGWDGFPAGGFPWQVWVDN